MAPIRGLIAFDSLGPASLLQYGLPSPTTRPDSSQCCTCHTPAICCCLPCRPLARLPFPLPSLRYQENQCPLQCTPLRGHRHICCLHAKPCKSANFCTAASPNSRCPSEHLITPISELQCFLGTQLPHPVCSFFL